MWDKYSEFKKPQISPSTYAKDFAKHRNHIAKLPTRSLDEASAIRDHLLSNLTPDAAKRCLTQLKACCNWAMDEGLIDTNPFATMKIKVPKGTSEEQDVNPFTKEERDLIIRTFASDRHVIPPADEKIDIASEVSNLHRLEAERSELERKIDDYLRDLGIKI